MPKPPLKYAWECRRAGKDCNETFNACRDEMRRENIKKAEATTAKKNRFVDTVSSLACFQNPAWLSAKRSTALLAGFNEVAEAIKPPENDSSILCRGLTEIRQVCTAQVVHVGSLTL